MNEQLEMVKLIAGRLDSSGIPYMITGSMAMTVYSVPRMTRDIDLIVEIALDKVADIISNFAKDCYIDYDTVRDAVKIEGMFNIIHNTWFMKADFIVRKNHPYRIEEFSRRRKVDIEGCNVFVVSPEDLILSKLVWRSESQSELQMYDVRQIISTVDCLEWGYLWMWAEALGVREGLTEAAQHE